MVYLNIALLAALMVWHFQRYAPAANVAPHDTVAIKPPDNIRSSIEKKVSVPPFLLNITSPHHTTPHHILLHHSTAQHTHHITSHHKHYNHATNHATSHHTIPYHTTPHHIIL
jgi:hypothetical protein